MQLDFNDNKFSSAVDKKGRNFIIREIGKMYFIYVQNLENMQTIEIKGIKDASKELKVSYLINKYCFDFYVGSDPSIYKKIGLEPEIIKKKLNNGT